MPFIFKLIIGFIGIFSLIYFFTNGWGNGWKKINKLINKFFKKKQKKELVIDQTDSIETK